MWVNNINDWLSKTTKIVAETEEKAEYDMDIDRDFTFFRKTILENLGENFYPWYLRWKGDITELKAEKEEWIKRYFDMFMLKIDKFIEDIDKNKYKDYWDFIFVKNYIVKLFENFYLKKPLKEVFWWNKEIEERFLNLSEKYLFNASRTYVEIMDYRKDSVIQKEKEDEQIKKDLDLLISSGIKDT